MGNIFGDERIDYELAILKYREDMESLGMRYKYSYDSEMLQSINLLARKLVKLKRKANENAQDIVDEDMIKFFFIESLRVLENKGIIDYYKSILKRTEIKRDSSLDFNDGRIVNYEDLDGLTYFDVKLPTGKLTIEDEFIFSHEMGHVPEIDVPRKTFLEYQEVLPIFMEYLLFLKRYGKNLAKDCFIEERITMDVEHSEEIKRFHKACDKNSKIQQLYAKLRLADSFKYLESTEFVLQLIDIFEKDKKKVSKEIEQVIEGKSMIEVASDLSIDTAGCKRLLKEYQNYRKRD